MPKNLYLTRKDDGIYAIVPFLIRYLKKLSGMLHGSTAFDAGKGAPTTLII